MPSREFCAGDGARWRVWSVIPGWRDDGERRRGYDRRSPDPVLRYAGPERRTGDDRRARNPLLAPGFRDGWLVFERSGERRRLAPIPAGWERMTERGLERLCRSAEAGG